MPINLPTGPTTDGQQELTDLERALLAVVYAVRQEKPVPYLMTQHLKKAMTAAARAMQDRGIA